MRKIYMMPSTEVFDVMVDHLLTSGSNLDINDPKDDTVDDPEELLSRRRNNVWDDEEDEEDDNYGYKY